MLLARADKVIELGSQCRLVALLGHATMSDLSPPSAPKQTPLGPHSAIAIDEYMA
jgi:hypothetical protein